MKTYLPQIERRITIRQLQTFGIIAYDLDNCYPQRVLELIGASPTAKDCWEKRTSYFQGRGFEDIKFAKAVINDKGLTVKKLLRSVASDKALFRGFGIHVNYNANFAVSSANYVKFEDIRIGDPDSPATKDKFAVYFDWGHKTWKNISRAKIAYLNAFNPDPEVISQQVIDAGGWENYKGQLFYFNPEINDYPLAECDSVIEDIETEGGIKTFNNRSVTTGFMPSAMLFKPTKSESLDEYGEETTTMQTGPSELEKSLGQFQGAKHGQRIMVIEFDSEDTKPELVTFPIQNNDKLFEVTEKSVERRIIKGFSVPKELINSEKATGLSNGGEKKEAIRQFNDDTADDRAEIAEAFEAIFSLFHTPINPSGNYNIIETPADVAEDNLGKTAAGGNITELLSSSLPNKTKIAALITVYGISPKEAKAMVNPIPEVEQTQLIEQ